VAFTLLTRALERLGYRVRVNDHRLAREEPVLPVGIAGYPHTSSELDAAQSRGCWARDCSIIPGWRPRSWTTRASGPPRAPATG
jgi:hypothetical protein